MKLNCFAKGGGQMTRITAEFVRRVFKCERAINVVRGSSEGNVNRVGCRAKMGQQENTDCCVHGESCPEGKNGKLMRGFVARKKQKV